MLQTTLEHAELSVGLAIGKSPLGAEAIVFPLSAWVAYATPRQPVEELVVDRRINPLRTLRIMLAQCLEVGVERLAEGSVGLVVTPFAPGCRDNLDAATNQLTPELVELMQAPGERLEQSRTLRAHRVAALLRYLADAVVERQEPVAVDLVVLTSDGGQQRKDHVELGGIDNRGSGN